MRKKMKNVAVMVLGFALTGAILTGCGESQQSRQDTQQGIPANISEETGQDAVSERTETDAAEKVETDTAERAETDAAEKPETDAVEKVETDAVEKVETDAAEKPAQASEEYEDNFAVDSKAAKEFAEKIKEAAAQKDLEALAELTAFPVYVGLPDVGVVETKEDFLNLGAAAVFTDDLLESIEMADIENLQPSMAGFSVSDGRIANINFGVADGRLAINGINY